MFKIIKFSKFKIIEFFQNLRKVGFFFNIYSPFNEILNYIVFSKIISWDNQKGNSEK